jgi:hypothetical protein
MGCPALESLVSFTGVWFRQSKLSSSVGLLFSVNQLEADETRVIVTV